MIDVSVIVPVYNCQKYLKNCVKSILEQKNINIEIVLINDGSTDESGRICEQLKEMNKNIVVIHQKNAGAGAARNAGIKVSKGKYIGFTDADDWIENDMYSIMFKDAESEQCDMVICRFYEHLDNGRCIKSWSAFEDKTVFNKDTIKHILIPLMVAPDVEKNYSHVIAVPMWAKLFNREFLLKNDIAFDEYKNGQDAIFSLLATSYAENIIYSDKCLYHYKSDRGATLSRKYSASRYIRQQKTQRRKIEIIKSKGLYTEELTDRFQQETRHHVFFMLRMIFSKYNKTTGKEKINEANKFLDSIELKKIFSNIKLRKLSFQQAVLYWLIKHKCINSLYALINVKYRGRI